MLRVIVIKGVFIDVEVAERMVHVKDVRNVNI